MSRGLVPFVIGFGSVVTMESLLYNEARIQDDRSKASQRQGWAIAISAA